MGSGKNTKYNNIITTISSWPPEEKILLLQDILKSLKTEWPHRPARQNTLETALGLLVGNEPAPTDEEVKKWLTEHRLEKYS